MQHLERLPREAEQFTVGPFEIEIIDMDLQRIDKVCVRCLRWPLVMRPSEAARRKPRRRGGREGTEEEARAQANEAIKVQAAGLRWSTMDLRA